MDRWLSRAADANDPFPNANDDLDAPSRPGQRRTWGETDYPLDRGNDPATSDEQHQRPGRNLPVWGGNDLQESGGGMVRPGQPPDKRQDFGREPDRPLEWQSPLDRPEAPSYTPEGVERPRHVIPPYTIPREPGHTPYAPPPGTVSRAQQQQQPSLPPTVAQRWQTRVGAPMTAEDVEQLRMLGVIA